MGDEPKYRELVGTTATVTFSSVFPVFVRVKVHV